jgi:UDP-N-acetylmuramyl pentapeptide synthase
MSMEAGVLPMTVEEIADSVGGSLHDTDPDTVLAGCAQYDLRLMESGGLFVAFQGQRVDARDLASRAVAYADARRIVSSAVARGVEAEQVPDAPAALELVRRRRAAGDAFPIKGSHALGLQSPAQQLVMDGATHDHANAKRMGK